MSAVPKSLALGEAVVLVDCRTACSIDDFVAVIVPEFTTVATLLRVLRLGVEDTCLVRNTRTHILSDESVLVTTGDLLEIELQAHQGPQPRVSAGGVAVGKGAAKGKPSLAGYKSKGKGTPQTIGESASRPKLTAHR